MKRTQKRVLVCAAIAIGSVALTLLLANVRFFKILDLKAQDAHFVLRGKVPTRDIIIVGLDDKTENHYSKPTIFWQDYYAEGMRAAADGGAKVFVLDVAFLIPVAPWEPNNDAALAEAFTSSSQKMAIVTALVPSTADQKDPAFTVPINLLGSAFGTAGFANITSDSDDFVRRQVLIETPKAGVPTESLTRSMALRAAEKFLGKEAQFRNGKLYLGDREIPTDQDNNLIINYAGPAGTFPEVSLYDVIQAEHAGNTAQLEKWFKGKAVLLGPDYSDDRDRHDTPFYTAFGSNDIWTTAGVEIHANALRTLLTGDFLRSVPQAARIASLLATAGATVAVVASFAAVSQTAIWSIVLLGAALAATDLLFRVGWLLSSTDVMIAFLLSLVGGIIYRFATAEKKSSFFKSAVALFVGKQVARSLDQSDKIGLTGKRRMVTILFTDIRGFTAFCDSKDPGIVVDLLNTYMATMCAIIVKYNGHVNKFIGDGILAVFSDDDDNARPGDHAHRAVTCATEMVTAPNDFKTGAGLHSGEVVIGNVGSSDKMEFTVLGDTVNIASRLESLNKEHKTRLLLSGGTLEIIGGGIDTMYLGDVPVRGKTIPMKLYTVSSLVTEELLRAHAVQV